MKNKMKIDRIGSITPLTTTNNKMKWIWEISQELHPFYYHIQHHNLRIMGLVI